MRQYKDEITKLKELLSNPDKMREFISTQQTQLSGEFAMNAGTPNDMTDSDSDGKDRKVYDKFPSPLKQFQDRKSSVTHQKDVFNRIEEERQKERNAYNEKLEALQIEKE